MIATKNPPVWPAARSAKEQFSGAWSLVSWKIEQADGAVTDPLLGPCPVGWIMYQPAGYMSVVLMRPDSPKFASDDLMQATPAEIRAAFEGFVSYCGSYEVNAEDRFVIHRLHMSWFPNLVGTEQKRFFEFSGDRLTLKTPRMTLMGADQVHCLVWQRLRQGSSGANPQAAAWPS